MALRNTIEFPIGLWEVDSKNTEETLRLGELLGEILSPGAVVALSGNLGSGKTLFVKGVARGMGVADEGEVTSPTFVLVNEYKARIPIYHVDLYRLHDPCQTEDLGWEEFIYGAGVTLVEWPEKVLHLLPEDRIEIRLEWMGEGERRLTFRARNIVGEDLIHRLLQKWMKGE